MTMTATKTLDYSTLADDYRNDPDRLELACEQCADIIARAAADRPINDAEAITLAAAMNMRVPVRDTVIVNAVAAPDEATDLMLTRHPREKQAQRYLYVHLNRVFNDPQAAPDPWRVRNMLGLCERAEKLSPDQTATHDAKAWILWAAGDEPQAKREAVGSLRLNDQGTLPKIILAGIITGTRPAYLIK
jgi:hypothetical protein